MSNPTISGYDPIPSASRRCSVTLRPTPGRRGGGRWPYRWWAAATRRRARRRRRGLASAGFTGRARPDPGPARPRRRRPGRRRARGAGDRRRHARPRSRRRVRPRRPAAQAAWRSRSPRRRPGDLAVAEFAQAVTEGVLLARWRFSVGADADEPTLESLVLVGPPRTCRGGRARGPDGARPSPRRTTSAVTWPTARPTTLTAARMAEVAAELGPHAGLEVEVFDKDQLIEMGCGGILGVNMGSVEPPRLIRLRYAPESPTGRLALVGKGDHVRLGRHQPQAERRVARADEERHDRRRGDPRVDDRPAGARLHDRGHRLPDAAPTTCRPARR